MAPPRAQAPVPMHPLMWCCRWHAGSTQVGQHCIEQCTWGDERLELEAMRGADRSVVLIEQGRVGNARSTGLHREWARFEEEGLTQIKPAFRHSCRWKKVGPGTRNATSGPIRDSQAPVGFHRQPGRPSHRSREPIQRLLDGDQRGPQPHACRCRTPAGN